MTRDSPDILELLHSQVKKKKALSFEGLRVIALSVLTGRKVNTLLKNYLLKRCKSEFLPAETPERNISYADAFALLQLQKYNIAPHIVWNDCATTNDQYHLSLPFHAFVTIIFQSVLHERVSQRQATSKASDTTNTVSLKAVLNQRPSIKELSSMEYDPVWLNFLTCMRSLATYKRVCETTRMPFNADLLSLAMSTHIYDFFEKS